jgi:hypothetical protein
MPRRDGGWSAAQKSQTAFQVRMADFPGCQPAWGPDLEREE